MTPPNQSLDKAFALLREIAAARGQMSIPQLAHKLGLPKATAHRLVTSLEEVGAVVKEKRGHYHIAPMIADLAAAADHRALMARIARPALKALARAHRKTAHLAALDGDMVTYLAKESGGSPLLTLEGTQLEAYCSGLGKALLAHLPEAQREAYLAEGPFPRLTARTLTEPDALRAELERTRERGYALDNAEVLDSLKCVAVPVFDTHGRAVAALSLSGAAEDYTPAYIKRAAAELTALANDIHARLFATRRQ
jgi:IclR family acetate operon transcriptional repressor